MLRVILSIFLLSTGCFSYASVPIAVAPVGAKVRVHLTDAGFRRIGSTMNWLDEPYLVGQLVERDPTGSVLLEVRSENLPNRRSVDTPLNERITLVSRDIAGVERGHVNAVRTTTLVAGTALVSYFVYTKAKKTLGPPLGQP